MRLRISILTLLASTALCQAATATRPTTARSWKVPAVERKLSNGLLVVVSEDNTTPTFGICISYGIGFRIEPKGQTGFAHLFEHFMFQGTPNAPKGTFGSVIDGGGGSFNGATRSDFTEYTESAPVSALDPILWLEADRMKTLDFSVTNLNNQRNVVKEEARSTILNQPYGLFYALDLPQKAYDTFPNNHNLIGDFADLDAASIEKVKAFFEEYYAPNNAVLAVAGDVTPEDVFAKAEKYFGSIPRRKIPVRPDVSEPPQKSERQFTQEDHLSHLPALAIGYRMPPRKSRDAIVGVVVADLLYGGNASLLYQSLVQNRKLAISVKGGVNWPLGNPYEYNGPTLMTGFIVYPDHVKQAEVMSAYDQVIAGLASQDISASELEDAITKVRSDWYSQLEEPVARAEALSLAVLFDGTPNMVNAIPAELAGVTPADIRAFVRKYMAATNRTIINRVPVAAVKRPISASGKEGQ